MNEPAFLKMHALQISYGYLAQNTAQISRSALASGSQGMLVTVPLAPCGC
jgi:hypothetical protein